MASEAPVVPHSGEEVADVSPTEPLAPPLPKNTICPLDDEVTQAEASSMPQPFLDVDIIPSSDMSPRCVERKMSFCPSPDSCKSTGSAAEFFRADQTIIILDWDDTLCPTTECMRTQGLSVVGDPPSGEFAASLEELTKEVRNVLEACLDIAGLVVIVTNAEEGWVELAQKAWLPGVEDILSRCEVASARSTWEPQGVTSPAGWKARTFEEFIDRFYSRYPNQSWKNVVSVGDAPHEREALARVVRFAPRTSSHKCRSKSVKFAVRPTVDQMISELQMLSKSIFEIVTHDGDLDLYFTPEALDEALASYSSRDALAPLPPAVTG